MNSDNKNEVSFYPEIADKFKKLLVSVFPDTFKVECSLHSTLDKMVKDLECKLGGKTDFFNDYIPKLDLDILFGIKGKNEKISLLLFEVKYTNNLSLSNFSQLAGYLQVAQKIKLGFLFLVEKGRASHRLSNDFSDILSMKKLPLEWQLVLTEAEKINTHNFKIGICFYVPNNGLQIFPTDEFKGITDIYQLGKLITKDLD